MELQLKVDDWKNNAKKESKNRCDYSSNPKIDWDSNEWGHIRKKFIKCFLIHVFFPSWQHTHFRIQKISEISSVTKQEARARARAQVENKGQVVAHTRTTPFYCIWLLCTILYVSRLFLISLVPWIDKPWGNTLREKLYDPVRLRYINWGAKERQHQRSSPAVSGALQYFCYQGCIARCYPAPSVSVLSLGESEAMVLC